jgi:hypothetical protein
MDRTHSQNLPSRLLRLLGGFRPSGYSTTLIWGWITPPRSASVSQDTINIDQSNQGKTGDAVARWLDTNQGWRIKAQLILNLGTTMSFIRLP